MTEKTEIPQRSRQKHFLCKDINTISKHKSKIGRSYLRGTLTVEVDHDEKKIDEMDEKVIRAEFVGNQGKRAYRGLGGPWKPPGGTLRLLWGPGT